MDDQESLSHCRWECKYHVVFIPKYRKKVLFGKLRRHLGEVFHRLAQQKECRIEEGHVMSDHVHMMIATSAEVCSLASDWLYQGQERDPHCSGVWGADAQFRRSELLGARVFCLDSRSGRGRDPRLYTGPGEGRPPARTVKAGGVISHRQGGQQEWGPR